MKMGFRPDPIEKSLKQLEAEVDVQTVKKRIT
jgi:hypothetical protein